MIRTQHAFLLVRSFPQHGRPASACQARVGSVEDLDRVIGVVLEQMGTLAYGERDIFSVRLSLEEAITNALKHGNKYDPTKVVEVTWEVDGERVLATVEDEGDGFDPASIPDPLSEEGLARASGRGLLLMKHYLTWLRYNERGNRVTLCKHRTVS
jgi:serine/threonine-protein kinase RsbW